MICESCGVQIFVRGKRGISLFEKILKSLKSEVIKAPDQRHFRLIAVVNRISQLRAKALEFKNNAGILEMLIPSKETEKVMEMLENEAKRLEASLNKFDLRT